MRCVREWRMICGGTAAAVIFPASDSGLKSCCCVETVACDDVKRGDGCKTHVMAGCQDEGLCLGTVCAFSRKAWAYLAPISTDSLYAQIRTQQRGRRHPQQRR